MQHKAVSSVIVCNLADAPTFDPPLAPQFTLVYECHQVKTLVSHCILEMFNKSLCITVYSIAALLSPMASVLHPLDIPPSHHPTIMASSAQIT